MHRLRKNIGGYFGETINIAAVLRDVEQSAIKFGWHPQPLPVSDRLQLVALSRIVPEPRRHIYISAGIHGDEPAGPLAARRLVVENQWPNDISLWLCSCLNPAGFRSNRRENEDGVDLNRDYRHLQSSAVRAHIQWLEAQPRFDCAFCLHEDWEADGFYVYELNPDNQPSVAPAILQAVAPICPIDQSPVIEAREARAGLIQPNPDPDSRPQWPEAFYLVQHKTRLSYTLEAPSDFSLETRVNALVAGVRGGLAGLARLIAP